MITALNFLYFSILVLSFLTIAMTLGIVWRAEQLLDMSYKFLLSAAIVFTVGVILDILVLNYIIPDFGWDYYIKALFIIFFVFSVMEMRLLLRRLDGELSSRRRRYKK